MWPTDLQFRTRSAERRFAALRALVDSMDVLPTTARLPMRILELHRDPASTLDQFGEALMADPSLATRVLGLANSAWAAQGKRITRISDAIRVIGVNNLLPLLFGVSLAGMFNRADLPPSQREELWRTAVLKAVVARFTAEAQGSTHAEEAFLCGLIQDIGLPVLFAGDRATAVELNGILGQDASLCIPRERELFGLSHPELAAVLAQKLGLPEVFVEAARLHHDLRASALGSEFPDLADAITLSASVPHRPLPSAPPVGENFHRVIKETDPELARQGGDFVGGLMKQYQSLMRLLAGRPQPGGEHANFRNFLQDVCQRVAQTLTGAIEQSAVTVTQLQHRIAELEAREAAADVDPQTGLLHRAGLTARAARLLKLASESGRDVAIGAADIDDFAKVNATHGREVADAALRALGRALKDCVGQSGAVGRWDGDEFAFLLVIETPQQLKSMGDELTRVLSLQDCRVGDKRFPLGCSGGIVSIGVPAPTASFDKHLGEAQSQMKQAKSTGKNRCLRTDHPPAALAA